MPYVSVASGAGANAPRIPASTVCAITCCRLGSPTKKLARLQEFRGPAQDSSAGVGARHLCALASPGNEQPGFGAKTGSIEYALFWKADDRRAQSSDTHAGVRSVIATLPGLAPASVHRSVGKRRRRRSTTE